MLQLKKFPDIPGSTQEEARESRPHPEWPRFCLLAGEEGSFPCAVGKEFPAFRRISRGGALHRKGEGNSRVVPPFPESPRYLSPFQGNLFSLHCLDFQAEDRLTPRWIHRGWTTGLSLLGRESIPGVPTASQEEALSTGKAKELQGRATIPRVPQMSQSIPEEPVFPALP